IDASQARPSPEHLGEQAKETVQGTTKHPIGQASEMIRGALAGKVEQVVPGAGEMAKKVAGSAGDMAKKVMLPARILLFALFAGGLVVGLIAGLLLGQLMNNTARSSARARAELPAPPEPERVAAR